MATFPATYVSGTQFTISGDVTSYFPAGIRARVDCGGWVYSSVESSSYGAPNTTITLTQSVLSDPCGYAEVSPQHPLGVAIHDHSDDNKGGAGVVGTPPDHAWSGTSLKFRKPDGSWGTLVDLLGGTGSYSISTLAEDNVPYTASSFDVADGTRFIADHIIMLTDGTNWDLFRIDSISTNTLNVTPIRFGTSHNDYDTGDDVVIVGHGFWWRGAWTTSTPYVVGNVVENDGSAYYCILDNTSSASDEPGVGGSWETYWKLVAQKGDTGATGATGDTGAAGESFIWEGAWVTATGYTENDFVRNDNSLYICISDHTSDATSEPGVGTYWGTYWELAMLGMEWKGAWALSTSYGIYDVVENDNVSYICIIAHTSSAGDEPGVGGSWTTYWERMSGTTSSISWLGAWQTAYSYIEDDLVENDGSAYICTAGHTSDATSEPGVGAYWGSYWDLFVSSGDVTPVVPTDICPPAFKWKGGDEITVLAGRYHKGGYRKDGHYQDTTNIANYWDVAKTDVDIDATYSAGVTSGMIGGAKVNSSWYAAFLMTSDPILLVLPYVRVDTIDYNVTHAGKTTITPAAHSDGTTAENGFIVANDAWNTYRLMLLDRADPTVDGEVFTIEDTVNSTPDEIVIDGDQTSYISEKDWLQLIPPSGTSCVYLGDIPIGSGGSITEFIRVGWRYQWVTEIDTIAGTMHATDPGNTDMSSAMPPTARIAYLHPRADATSSNTLVRLYLCSGLTGTNVVKMMYLAGAAGTLVIQQEMEFVMSATGYIRNYANKNGPAAADNSDLNVSGFEL